MRIQFTKMQGAGNDFVVLDETRSSLGLTAAHYRFLGDRHFGVGADQILTVRPSPAAGIDFEYIIHNADGAEVEQCGNGARCFARFVREHNLSNKDILRVQTKKGVIEPRFAPDGRITVNMGIPRFDIADTSNLPDIAATVSMGNPHAVILVEDVNTTEVATLGPQTQQSGYFPQGVNVGFMQVNGRHKIQLRVFERGVGETLSCGTGACAAVVSGIRLGLLANAVEVETRGGLLGIVWAGEKNDPVWMSGPAVTVFSGEIQLPNFIA